MYKGYIGFLGFLLWLTPLVQAQTPSSQEQADAACSGIQLEHQQLERYTPSDETRFWEALRACRSNAVLPFAHESIATAAAPPINEQDSLALVALYNATDGNNWTDNTGWLSDPVSSWFGVTVEEDRVTRIRLEQNQLNGTIPAELGDLTNLIQLDLFQNQLTGTIPPALGNLPNLTQLYLYNNDLTGGIPPELGNLTSLVNFDVGANDLTGTIPVELGNLTNLVYLFLGVNAFEGEIPVEFGNLTNMQFLLLGRNQLTGTIPTALTNLTNLTILGLGTNQLTGEIPSEFGNLTNLARLGVGTNQLTGSIPDELGNLTNLTSLILGDNGYTGSIPATLGNLTNLEYLDLRAAGLSEAIPPELGNLTNLTFLGLSLNELTGPIPPELGNLTNLTVLDLGFNQLTGTIPTEVGALTNLTELYLSTNQLSGAPPVALGNLPALTILELNDNTDLSGSLPASFTNLPLTTFFFNNTGLCEPPDGDFQNWLSGIATLQRTSVVCTSSYDCAAQSDVPQTECEALVALYNATDGVNWTTNTGWLSDPVPTWFGVAEVDGLVTSLVLANNQLAGTLPPEMGNLVHLTEMFLEENQLAGSIPPELGNLTNLSDLGLYLNQLSGTIPPELGNLTNLSSLDLNNNQLTGGIPVALGDLANLTFLSLHDNQLTGSIPPELGSIPNLNGLHLDNNQLSGDIPVALGNLSNLSELDLSTNELTGEIPHGLGMLTSLHFFSVEFNQLSGTLPDELGDLTNLSELFLNDNANLTGALPLTLTNLALTSFQFGNTDLCEPPDAGFQSWLAAITDVQSTGVTCGTNQPPQLDTHPNDVQLLAGNTTPAIDLNNFFSDPDGDVLSYSASNDTPAVATGSVQGSQFTITAHAVGTATITVTADDGNGGQAQEDVFVTVTINYPSSVSYSINRSFGNAEQPGSYRLVALPGNQNQSIAATLTGTSGTDWRVFWDTGANEDDPEDYLMEYNGSGTFNLSPGRGFWLLSNTAWTHVNDAPTVPLSEDGLYAIPVHAGWNIISNPFEVDIPWALVQQYNNDFTAPLWSYNGSFRQDAVFASPVVNNGQAFYFENTTGLTALNVPYPPAVGSSTTPAAPSLISLHVSQAEQRLTTVQVGLDDAADIGYDKQDHRAPAALFGDTQLRLVNAAFAHKRGRWAIEVQPRQPMGSTFDLTLQTTPGAVLSLDAQNLGAFANDAVVLLDRRTAKTYDLHAQPTLTLVPTEEESHYRLFIGTVEAVQAAVEAEQPEVLTLLANYPNPFRTQTQIEYALPESEAGRTVQLEIFDLLGRRVRTLVNQPQDAGFYQVTWDGRDAAGQPLASGVYVYRLSSDAFSKTRQLVLLK